ncbi:MULTISPECIES: hypothetical protein [unclassified Arthrobacter]|uniref:hypothetical protein n=1 Tax=unclassified Arthrobacter TaxID=235627 RepID=UPI001E2F15EC|nr:MULTISPECIES: hypothetical protein [unclassified Arthrobacter]MCC9146152.1 hypothetical protein [Arthrobacter sp. zg-Y919]MDK1277382.1 hypothetical protein [Arthrobacter sp. zg.Y919]WIB03879.1 hypothetical protein QNO10_04205 [Arthrobacter sp. zg-Y919]
MSRKSQQGAAESAEAGQDTRSGPAARLRPQPGLRTAAAAFIVTVLLGLGGTAAYAYWSQSTTATITVLPTAKVRTPGPLHCNPWGTNELSWKTVADVDSDVVYVLTFAMGSTSKTYALPLTTTEVKPVYLSGLASALGTSKMVPLTVTLRTATVNKAVPAATAIAASDILAASEASTLQMSYWSLVAGAGNYPCAG